jgi:phytoene desaturase
MSKRAVVIGAGFGGLALGVRLQSAGVATTILEGRDKPGGRAYVWHDQGFTFDAGPTVITDPACLEELFALSGRKLSDYVTLAPVTPFYRLLWDDGARFDYVNDQAELDRQIAALNPADVDGYKRFLKFSEEVYDEGYKRLGHVPFLKITDMLAAAPELLRLQAWRSVYSNSPPRRSTP